MSTFKYVAADLRGSSRLFTLFCLLYEHKQSYILMISVSVRFPKDHAAFARTFVDRSSRAARIMFAVSATNITSWGKNIIREYLKTFRWLFFLTAQMLVFTDYLPLSNKGTVCKLPKPWRLQSSPDSSQCRSGPAAPWCTSAGFYPEKQDCKYSWRNFNFLFRKLEGDQRRNSQAAERRPVAGWRRACRRRLPVAWDVVRFVVLHLVAHSTLLTKTPPPTSRKRCIRTRSTGG